MKTILGVVILLALAPAKPGADAFEALLKETVALTNERAAILNETVPVLKTAKDKASAEAALPKLKALDERLAALKKKEAALGKRFADLGEPTAEQKQLGAKYQEPVEKAMTAAGKAAIALVPELERVKKIPEVAAVLKDVFVVKYAEVFKNAKEVFAQLEEAKAAAAKLKVSNLDSALQDYHLKHGEFPKALADLTKGVKAPLEPDQLLDPWDKPYQYDPAGPKNKGKKPDVWTVTPDKKVIGNWREAKK